MTTANNLQVIIDLTATEPGLEPEELEQLTRSLAEQLKEITEDTRMVREKGVPKGSKPGLAGFIWGVLQTEVSMKNIPVLLNFLGERFYGKTLKLEFTANGRSYKLEYRNKQQLNDAVRAIEQLVQIG